MSYQELLFSMKEKEFLFEQVSDKIWDFAEPAYKEFKSANLQKDFLKAQGFEVMENLGSIKTAFKASFGSGKPVIGFLGEYDALPQLSQVSDAIVKEELDITHFGHGCGHNLLGAGCMEAAVAVKDYIQNNKLSGTVIYYGCPAEEGGSGKTFMLSEGYFEGCDIALSWHPFSGITGSTSSLANARVYFNFEGVSSHAAASPHLGRSALDSVELMNVGVNYLREHVIPEARMHYAITNSGGDAPNVVQAKAQVLYSLRAPKGDQVSELLERVTNVAKGAALMCGTNVTTEIVAYYADIIQNKTLDSIMFKHINENYPLTLTEKEQEVADKFHSVGEPGDWLTYQEMAKKFLGEKSINSFKSSMADVIFPPNPLKIGSTDVGNVSWNVPTAWFAGCVWALGTPAHSWQATAQGKSILAHKGMHIAAQVLAKTAVDLLNDTTLVEKAKEDFITALAGRCYVNLCKNNRGDN